MEHCIFTAVRKANRVLFRHYQEALADTGVSIVQLSILRALERHGDLPLSRLADELAMDRTSLYRTVEPLVEIGAVNVESAHTGRSKIAKLTPFGQVTIERVMPFWAQAQKRVLEEVAPEVRSDFQLALTSILRLSN
ncbi:MarR family winged helix-turn-helix transcriptional regulator [uncultured Aliiroseovarius sp.]|uniref:MarR family winged helix-turn-helix transcriptional regulator n=1 Tax=uncultured Aliiroseovarius sp. TaxID=1658783 RepID=UPI002621CFF5|nr:MarR family winged helix-turn-helix transcriptional regulator [uncultured Aliiroseovarius sp.]